MKKLTNSTKVLRYIRKNPKAKASEVAKAVGVSINSVYQCTYNAKKKAKSLPMTAIKPSTNAPNARMSKALFSDPSEHGTQDSVNSPLHYKVGGIETIDYIEAKALNYNLGNVVKYVSRSDYKGNKVEDLKKARWYLCREISNLSK
jgi:hypothetical protein